MAVLEINPRYRDLLDAHGLTSAARLLALPGLIVSGHPDRHVVRVTLGEQSAYLKREHRIRWRDRLGSALAGFGFVSKSLREARTVAELRRAGVSVPDWIAAGEEGGRAFLLLEDLPGDDLRRFLAEHRSTPARQRLRFARRLGRALARLHEAGFNHPDLYAKHILVDPRTKAIFFLDWQRSTRRVPAARLVHDLAALDATVADELASAVERLFCLRAYLRARKRAALRGKGKQWALDLRRRAARLLRRRHVAQERASPPPVTTRGIVWLDGEALCVSQDFWEELGGAVPDWLPLPAVPSAEGTSRRVVSLPGGGRGLLVRRSCSRPLAWLWSLLRGKTLRSPEVCTAGALFRRQKHGQDTPRVLAFGQRCPRPWRTESFLLTEAAGPGEKVS